MVLMVLPMQAGQAADVASWHQLQAFQPGTQALSEAGGGRLLRDTFDDSATAQAIDAADRQLKQHSLVKDLAVTYLANAALVNEGAVGRNGHSRGCSQTRGPAL